MSADNAEEERMANAQFTNAMAHATIGFQFVGGNKSHYHDFDEERRNKGDLGVHPHAAHDVSSKDGEKDGDDSKAVTAPTGKAKPHTLDSWLRSLCRKDNLVPVSFHYEPLTHLIRHCKIKKCDDLIYKLKAHAADGLSERKQEIEAAKAKMVSRSAAKGGNGMKGKAGGKNVRGKNSVLRLNTNGGNVEL